MNVVHKIFALGLAVNDWLNMYFVSNADKTISKSLFFLLRIFYLSIYLYYILNASDSYLPCLSIIILHV